MLYLLPLVHAIIGAEAAGAILFGLGYFNTEEEVDIDLEAMSAICRSRR